MRSRAAAATLSGAGFEEVYGMEGGINAWEGLVAEGGPESGMVYFSPAVKTEELIALAWFLEVGAYQFYSELAATLKDDEAVEVYNELALTEERHQASLLKLYEKFMSGGSDSGFPRSAISSENESAVMEGGIRVSEALQWAKGKKVTEILEFSLSMETTSYDLYIKLERRTKDERSKEVFHLLSVEEKQHLERLSLLFEKRI